MNMKKPKKLMPRALGLAGGVALLGGGLFPAAAYGFNAAPAPETGTPFLQWGALLVFSGLCGAIMFKNAKRTPND